MSLLSVNLSDKITKEIIVKIKEEFLDKISEFDYTVFDHFTKEDQTTIQCINVDKTGNVLTLSHLIKFDYFQSSSFDPFIQSYGSIDITPSVRIIDSRVVSFVIKFRKSGSSMPEEDVFNIHIGEKKYLINQTFYDKSEFDGYVFQQSTIDMPTVFGLDYALEIIKKLKV